MPTYEYICQNCKRHHEALQSITAKPLIKCPKCAGQLKRLLGSGSGFIFKGSGFYTTDYRSKGYNEAKRKDKPSEPKDKDKDKDKEKDKPCTPGPSCADCPEKN